jgi:hypothetical protein
MSQNFIKITVPGPRPGEGFQKKASGICFDILGIDIVPQYRGDDQWMYSFANEQDAQTFKRFMDTKILSEVHEDLMMLKEDLVMFPVDEKISFPDESLAALRGDFSIAFTVDNGEQIDAKNAINFCLDIFGIKPVASYIRKTEKTIHGMWLSFLIRL